ncbi:hypothetical protein HMPREF9554_00900 [Treponema phagedenis F0421]|nr:hypothetical protein HMPREF9554_00900 [Treponema phagedenis F0421]
MPLLDVFAFTFGQRFTACLLALGFERKITDRFLYEYFAKTICNFKFAR